MPGRYSWAFSPGHPIAHADGKVLAHRLALYKKIGDGEHRCYWCGTPVSWSRGDLFADHVDHCIENDNPENLVQSCNPCNAHRLTGEEWAPWLPGDPVGRSLEHARCRRKHLMSPDNVYRRPDTGVRQCRRCIRLRTIARGLRVGVAELPPEIIAAA